MGPISQAPKGCHTAHCGFPATEGHPEVTMFNSTGTSKKPAWHLVDTLRDCLERLRIAVAKRRGHFFRVEELVFI